MNTRAGFHLLACSLCAVSLFGCTASPKGAERSPEATAHPRVVIQTTSRQWEVVVELARTSEEQARGLMFRERLGRDEGMLFVFPDETERTFWMKNTFIPLDMIFINGLGSIVGIVSRAEPRTETPRHVGVPSRYVLEVVGGWANEHGVKIGDKVSFRGPPGSIR